MPRLRRSIITLQSFLSWGHVVARRLTLPDFGVEVPTHSTLQETIEMKRDQRRASPHRQEILTDPRAVEFLQRGVQCHQAGLLDQAEDCYRRVLAVQPNHADGLHLLGVLAHQGGRPETAIDLIRLALRQHDQNPIYRTNLAVVLREQGELVEAVAQCRKAIELKADLADAHCVLGAALHNQGKLDQSIAASRLAIRHNPQYADAYSNLGGALRDQGKFAEALRAFRQAVQIKPDAPLFHFNLGVVLHQCGQLDEAISAYRQAIERKPDWAEAVSNLGAALPERGRLEEAIAACRDAIRVKPDLAPAHSNLAAALRDPSQSESRGSVFHPRCGVARSREVRWSDRRPARGDPHQSGFCRCSLQFGRDIERAKQARRGDNSVSSRDLIAARLRNRTRQSRAGAYPCRQIPRSSHGFRACDPFGARQDDVPAALRRAYPFHPRRSASEIPGKAASEWRRAFSRKSDRMALRPRQGLRRRRPVRSCVSPSARGQCAQAPAGVLRGSRDSRLL